MVVSLRIGGRGREGQPEEALCLEFRTNIGKFDLMPKTVREPIQVYLTPQERSELDRVAKKMGVSRSEALRRGVRALEDSGYDGALRELADDGLATPPTAGPGEPPPSAPVTSLRELLNGLAQDRRDR